MSFMKVSGAVVAAATALALTGGAYGDTGKSPNGAPGPAGNPNQPAATPQASGPQGPAGNDGGNVAAQSHGKSNASHGKSHAQSHGKSNASHGKSQGQSRPALSHANPNVGTPRKGGREDRPAGKITICHATRSSTNPYVEITISLNGLHGHGPAEDSRHHAGSWKDIIPAPEAGCPSTVQEHTVTPKEETVTPTTLAPQSEIAKFVAPTPEVAAIAPATATPQQVVLGARAQGGGAPAEESGTAPGAGKVLGASASGNAAPKAALAARTADERSGKLPFTGVDLVINLLAAAAALLGGFALRRATMQGR